MGDEDEAQGEDGVVATTAEAVVEEEVMVVTMAGLHHNSSSNNKHSKQKEAAEQFLLLKTNRKQQRPHRKVEIPLRAKALGFAATKGRRLFARCFLRPTRTILHRLPNPHTHTLASSTNRLSV